MIFAGVGYYKLVTGALALETKARGTAARIFTALFFALALYFSSKMVRLLLLLAPAASIAAAVSVNSVFGWIARVSLAIPQEKTDKVCCFACVRAQQRSN